MTSDKNDLIARVSWSSARLAIVLGSIVFVVVAGLVTTASTDWRSTAASARPQYEDDYRRPEAIPYPSHNARTPERELLGRTLFFDPRLSGSGWISCASCHNPGFSWSDGLPRALGHGMGQLGRRTPTLLNLAWSPALFWDGRAESLEEQALGPIEAAGEMNLKLDDMIARLQSIDGYRPLFERAYPGESISTETVAKAIATFERGLVSADAPFDRWIAGDEGAISAAAERGFVLFNEKARCSTCHSGWRFTDDSFYDIGMQHNDVGRAKVTPKIGLAHFAFKTPTLRSIAQRAPYMHDGSSATLEEVIDLYDRGGVVRRPSLSPEIKPLDLTSGEKQDLVAFLETLTSQDAETRVPVLPR
jgi:cytochrome c peroxidase